MFEAAASYLQKALTTGSGRIAQVAEMTRTDFIATMKLALQVSVLQATKEDQQNRLTRRLQALDDAAWPGDTPTRVLMIAENEPSLPHGSGLTKSHILNLFRKTVPGSVELSNIKRLGGVVKSGKSWATAAVFQVTIRNTTLQQDSMLGLMRKVHQQGVFQIENSDGTNPVSTIITAETKWDVTVSLQSDDQRHMAQNFIKVCTALKLDKFTRDNILTHCVRSSPGWSQWSDFILWARFQREKWVHTEMITVHEDDWGETKFPQSLLAPNIIINVASEKVREEIAEMKPSLVVYLGAQPGEFITVHGTVSSRPRGQGVAGADAARLRSEEAVKQLTSAGDGILELLAEAGAMASNGQGREAGDAIRQCKLRAAAIKDCTAKFLQGKVQQLVDSLNRCGGNVSEDEGRTLKQSCIEWAEELRREWEALGEQWSGVTVRIAQFTDIPKVHGERNHWWKFHNTPEALREPIWTLLTKELEIPGLLCAEPIMDAKGTWSKGEGVIVVIQLQEDFTKRCEPKHVSMAKPSLLSLLPATRTAGTIKKGAKLKVLWPGAIAQAPNDGEAQQVKDKIQELLLTGVGFWIPKTVEVSNEEVQVFLQGGQDQAPLLLSALGEARGEYDIRAIHHVLGHSRDGCDKILEVIGDLRQQGQIAPVCERDGLTLFIAKAFADAFLEDPYFDEDNGCGRLTFTSTVRPGNNVRDEVIAQLGHTFCPLIVSKLDGGVWLLPSFTQGQRGNARGDQEEQEQEALQLSGDRWWHVVTASHVLARKGCNNIVELLVESHLLDREAMAIRKSGAVLLIQKNSFWKQQLLDADDITPGQSIPTATLPITSESIKNFERHLYSRAAAIGSKWEETLRGGTEMCSEEVPDLVKELEQSFAAEIRKEVWGTLPPINHMSCLKVRNSYLRPSILGPGVIFLPHKGQLTGDWMIDIENCRAEFKSQESPEKVRIRTVAELLPDWDVATFGVGPARMLTAMVRDGRALVKQAVGGLVAILAERYVLDGQEQSSLVSHGFADSQVHLTPAQLAQSFDLQGRLNKLTMKECEKRLSVFFERGQLGVLASVQTNQQEKLCPVATEGVRADLCLRRLIQHPAMCDSRGLEKLNDVIEELGLCMLKVGEHGHHILIGSRQSGHPCFTYPENDTRLKRWDPARDDIHALESPENDNSTDERPTEKRLGSEVASSTEVTKRSRGRKSSAETGGQRLSHQPSDGMEEDIGQAGAHMQDE